MFTLWSLMSWVLLPLSLFLMLIMMVPLANWMDVYRLSFVNMVFNLQTPEYFTILPRLQLFTSVLFVSGLMCIWQFISLQYTEIDPYLKGQICQKANRWRKERNFWISSMTFTMYFMTWRYHAIKTELFHSKRRK